MEGCEMEVRGEAESEGLIEILYWHVSSFGDAVWIK